MKLLLAILLLALSSCNISKEKSYNDSATCEAACYEYFHKEKLGEYIVMGRFIGLTPEGYHICRCVTYGQKLCKGGNADLHARVPKTTYDKILGTIVRKPLKE